MALAGAYKAFTEWEGIQTAVTAVKDFMVATEGATVAEKALLAAEVAADALNPFGWVALGAAAVGGLVYWLSRSNDGTKQYIDTLRQQDQATGYNIAGYRKLAGQMQHNLDTQHLSITAAAQEYQAWQQSSSAAANLGSHLTTLQNTYGLTRTQAEQLATEAGVSRSSSPGAARPRRPRWGRSTPTRRRTRRRLVSPRITTRSSPPCSPTWQARRTAPWTSQPG